MKTHILNKIWNVNELLLVSSTKLVTDLVSKYTKDPNCRPYDWIKSEKISEIEKASFIFTVLN